MFTDGEEEVSVFITCSTFTMPWSLRASDFRIVMASAVSALARLIMEPVTTISCSSGSGASVVAGACCAKAGIPMAAHRHAMHEIVNRLTCDSMLIGFLNFISVSLQVSYLSQRVVRGEDSPLRCRYMAAQ